jgi:acetyl-CoA carboxylase biotin carboxyl carrier protein
VGDVIRTDTDGTVYLRPEPGAACFVTAGQAVRAQETLALVEVMKTFTPVRAQVEGTVARVCVSDGDPVTEGDVLFWMDPS